MANEAERTEADTDAPARARWVELSPTLDRWMARAGAKDQFKIQSGSSLAGDNAVARELLMSTPVQAGMVIAVEHLHALKVLIVDARSLHPTAPFTLARGAIEAGATAYWVLSPRSRNERVLRALKWYSQDAKDNERFDLRSDSGQIARRLDRIRAVAESRGLDVKAATSGFTASSILADVDNTTGLGVKPMWQLCSGFAHGRLWSTIGALDRTDLGAADTDARSMSFTSSLHMPLAAAETALNLLTQLNQIWERRASNHHSLLGGQPTTAGISSTAMTVS